MRVLVVNPNATVEMTERIAAELRQYLPPDITLISATNHDGPASIQGAADGAAALPGTLALLRAPGHDGAVIACFDDTGLIELRDIHPRPLTGIGEAAFAEAAARGRPFAVLTTSPLSVPVLEANITAYGLAQHCRKIHASSIEVLDFETDRAGAERRLIAAGRDLLTQYPEVETVVLGCAGMGGLSASVGAALGVTVVDPIAAAAHSLMASFALS
ncbi:aspartate/glutamate racemase family protein [Sulfitobacter aestuarii]|uniref:Aspartate/glutamate racemase family protein n=1 Tax=Sulfitobacter aestuarii TaxID=2161676 RepID=A0ABW5U3I4_9RHOB